MALGWDVITVNDEEGFGAINVFTGGVRIGANTLAEAAKLINIQSVSNLVKLGVIPELEVLEGLGGLALKNRHERPAADLELTRLARPWRRKHVQDAMGAGKGGRVCDVRESVCQVQVQVATGWDRV